MTPETQKIIDELAATRNLREQAFNWLATAQVENAALRRQVQELQVQLARAEAVRIVEPPKPANGDATPATH